MKYHKRRILHSKLYISCYIRDSNLPYLLFIHGGPGSNFGCLEQLVEQEGIYSDLDFNLIFYDQRSCGRSPIYTDKVVHNDNIEDLRELVNQLTNGKNIKIAGLIGHSYGAKLLYDLLVTTNFKIPSIFISITKSLLTPRLNNLLLDLAYLKEKNRSQYQVLLSKMENFDVGTIWALTEEMASLFKDNKSRDFYYWANLECYEKVRSINDKINLPINTTTFMTVRRDLYRESNNLNFDVDKLRNPYCWINGLQDYIMNGPQGLLEKDKIIMFTKSAHYPHLEEAEKFCEVVNAFIKNL